MRAVVKELLDAEAVSMDIAEEYRRRGIIMAHKEKYCVYWRCERNGGMTCWDWGNKWAGMICPNNERCEKYRACANCNGIMGKCRTYKKIKRGEL